MKSMLRTRITLCAVVLISLITAGFWLLSPQTKWRYSSYLPTPRAMYVSATLANGDILFGEDIPIENEHRHLQLYHPQTDLWKKPAPIDQNSLEALLPKTENRPVASFWDMISQCDTPFIFVDGPNTSYTPQFTGNDAESIQSPLHRPDGTLFYFESQIAKSDQLNTTWKRLSYPPAFPGQILNILLLPDDRIFIGSYTNTNPTRIQEAIYNFKSDTWLVLNDPNAMVGQTCTLLPDGKILAIGGARFAEKSWAWRTWYTWYIYFFPHKVLTFGNIEITYSPVATCRLYNPSTNTWSITQSLNTPRAFHTTNLLPDGEILVSGGYTQGKDNSATNTCEMIHLKEIDP